MSVIADTHDIHCKCEAPFSHLLQSIFPPGHSDRHLTINEIIERDYQQCHSGGIEEEDLGIPLGGSAATGFKKEKDQGTEEEENLDQLLAAAAAAAEDTR